MTILCRGSLFLSSLLAREAGQQVAHSEDEVARSQDGDGAVHRLKVAHIETHQPEATFAHCGYQDRQIFGAAQLG
jgi:hypothetical protein